MVNVYKVLSWWTYEQVFRGFLKFLAVHIYIKLLSCQHYDEGAVQTMHLYKL